MEEKVSELINMSQVSKYLSVCSVNRHFYVLNEDSRDKLFFITII